MNTLLEASFDGAGRLLGSRFLIAILLPVLLVAGASGLVALGATGHEPGDALRAWQHYSASGQLLAVVWVLLGLLAASYLFALFHPSFLRVLEGSWPQWRALCRVRRRLIRRQRAKAQGGWDRVRALRQGAERAEGAALAARLLIMYPPPPRLPDGCLPTALGNRLRAAEYYPLERYGIDAIVIWPRLRPLLPPEASDRVTAARTTLDSTVSLIALSALFGTIWPVTLLIASRPYSLAALCLLGWPVTWAAYQAALQAAVSYGQEIRVVFDLHRHVLLSHLELDAPLDATAERRLWDDLTQFYQRNMPLPHDPGLTGSGTPDAHSRPR